MPVPIIGQLYQRLWKFVDHRQQGDSALRSDFDIQIDDMAEAINTALGSGLNYVGEWDAGIGDFPELRPDGGPISARDAWAVVGAGTVDGVSFAVGNTLVALLDEPEATYQDNWLRLELATVSALSQLLADISDEAEAARQARDLAERWASEDEDVPVETSPDRFSARHWAEKAEETAASVGDPAPKSRQINTGTGLTGGGNLSADRTLALAGQALALHNLGTNGLVARTAEDTFAARTITGSGSVNVSNGSGVAGSPNISVAALTQEQAEDADSTVQGTVSGQRLQQAVLAHTPMNLEQVLQVTQPTSGANWVISDFPAGEDLFIQFQNICVSGSTNKQLIVEVSNDNGSTYNTLLAAGEFVRADESVGGFCGHAILLPRFGLVGHQVSQGGLSTGLRIRPIVRHALATEDITHMRLRWFDGGNFGSYPSTFDNSGKVTFYKIRK